MNQKFLSRRSLLSGAGSAAALGTLAPTPVAAQTQPTKGGALMAQAWRRAVGI